MRRFALFAATAMISLSSLHADPDSALPGREIMPPESVVKDRFFAYIVGLVEEDVQATIPRAHLTEVLPAYAEESEIPFHEIRRLARVKAGDVRRSLMASFDEELAFPLPFTVLGLPVGEVRATPYVSMAEELLGAKSYRNANGEELRFESVHLFRLRHGSVTIDFRDWIDALLGSLVEDVTVRVALVFRHEERWYALVAAEGRNGRIHAGGYDFKADRGLIPVPDRFNGIVNRLAR